MVIMNLPHSDSQQLDFKRVCYLRVEDNFPFDLVLRLNLCTHIIVGFFSIDADSRISYEPRFANFCQRCRSISRQMNSNVQLLISIGGGGSGGFDVATSTSENRKKFVKSILNFMEQFDYDGVDIDWEFPAWKNISRRNERYRFVDLLKDIRFDFDDFRTKTGKTLILSTAVAAQFPIIKVSYLPKEMAKYIDFINLMTYDFYIHKWYFPFVGHNSALFRKNSGSIVTKTFNIEWAANYWNQIGIEKQKIMVGIPTYGKRYHLMSRHLNHPGAVAKRGKSDMSYSEVCEFLKQTGTIQKFDEKSKVPYAYNKFEWISYENEISTRYKTEWIKQNGFGGVMLFSLNADDFKGTCNLDMFPIHSSVSQVLQSQENQEYSK